MKRKKKIYIAIAFLITGCICVSYFYMFHSKHRNISEEEATESFYAPELLSSFIKKGNGPNQLVDQVVQVEGKLTSIQKNTIVLNGMVQLDFLQTLSISFRVGDNIIAKGRCVGYDDLLEVVKIDQATLITNQISTK